MTDPRSIPRPIWTQDELGEECLAARDHIRQQIADAHRDIDRWELGEER